MPELLKYEDITEARQKIYKAVRRTPIDFSTTFSAILGEEVYFKYENLQKTGSFKIRGAFNKILGLTDSDRQRGVIAASAGNHAQGVAYAASRAGCRATIVMPEGVTIAKLMATKSYGAEVVLSGQSYDEAFIAAEKLQAEKEATFIHAFNDVEVMAGQGTVGLEIFEDVRDADTVLVPIGGGGLIAGTAVALKHLNPRIKVIGVQAEGAPAMKNAVLKGSIRELDSASTIADGIAVKHPGSLTFPIVQKYVDDIVLVNDEEIAEAILMMLERAKTMCEGAGAAGAAAMLHKHIRTAGKTVILVSGGNIDVHTLSIIIERGLIKIGRYLRVKTVVMDKPGVLQKLLAILATTKANVVSIHHERILPRIPISKAEIQLVLETRDKEHVREITDVLKFNGYKIAIDTYE
ncbi:MAG: threonine ammonia-lyase [Thermincola sp.]|nr:threonine ammonia-lyase [Thermincola sp.]MDT3702103.1 threonine ammonia-lyase [Thermincola sp.]